MRSPKQSPKQSKGVKEAKGKKARTGGKHESGPFPRFKKHYQEKVVPGLLKAFGYRNVMQVPRFEKIVVNDLQEHTFYAKLVIRQQGELIEVDSRPSDAIALGVANEVPIYVHERVLDDVML